MNTETALESWHRLVRTCDANGLRDLIADDAVFHSPIVHTPQRGKTLVHQRMARMLEASR